MPRVKFNLVTSNGPLPSRFVSLLVDSWCEFLWRPNVESENVLVTVKVIFELHIFRCKKFYIKYSQLIKLTKFIYKLYINL